MGALYLRQMRDPSQEGGTDIYNFLISNFFFLISCCWILFVFSCSFLVYHTEQVRNKLLTLLAIMLEFGALIWYVKKCRMFLLCFFRMG